MNFLDAETHGKAPHWARPSTSAFAAFARNPTSFRPPTSFMTNSKGWIFAAGVVALALSLYLWFSGSQQAAIFVGLWVPSLWILADLVDQVETVAQ